MKTICSPPVPCKACVIIPAIIVSLLAARDVSARLDLGGVLTQREHPGLACDAEELERLRLAYRGPNPDRDVVARHVKEAERAKGAPIVFPPRGGQHNQWYQCDQCEMALKTIDTAHHRCPKCETVYSGPPYDDVIFSQQHSHNLHRMLTAAWAYAISQDREFAKEAARILLGYAERYEAYPYHSASLETSTSWGRRAGGHLFEQTLTEASCLASQIGPAYDLIHDSGVLSEADHGTIRQGLLLPMLKNIDQNKAGKSNWQTWHNAALLWGGALLHEPAWVEKAIADPDNGFYRQMDISVSKEGMWYENSWGYHFYTLSALVNMAETGRHLGIDLWSDARLKNMFTLPVYYTMADGMLPRFGDDVNSSVKRIGRLLEPAYLAYQDPQILSLLGDTRDFEAIRLGRSAQAKANLPDLAGMVFPDAGHAILRTHAQAGLTAAMTFGPYGGFHGHYDKLSFVFFGFSQELGVDPGRARSQAYRLPIHSNWYKATLSHNTVLVNRNSQKPAAGKLRLFERQDDYTVVAASCDEAYPGVEHTRWLVLTGTYLLVFDTLRSETEHQFDWTYHNQGSQVVCEAAGKEVTLASRFAGSEYIQNCREGTTADPVSARFEHPKVTTHLTVAAQEGTVVTVGDGVGASVADRVPMVMITREGRSARFAAVLEPTVTGKPPGVDAVRLSETDACSTITVRRGGSEDTWAILPDDTIRVSLSKRREDEPTR